MTTAPDAVVIGAGFAGLSAAVRLVGHGARVTVLEERPRLGGRAAAFTDRATGERVDNGQHVLFGCYRETYRFLDAIGTTALAPLQPRLSLLMAGDGRTYRLTCPPLPPPWHLIIGVLRWRALSFADRLAVLRLRRLLGDVRRRGADAVAASVPVSMTVSDWLRAQGQTPRLCRWLWAPLAVAALNQSPDAAAAVPFVRVLGELFGPRTNDAAIGLPAVPLDDLYAEPARRLIERAGGRVVLRARARLRVRDDGRLTVGFGEESVSPSVVISAVPWHDVARLWDPGVPPSLSPLARQASAMVSSPIVTVNLWFDGPVTDAAFVGLVDGPMHWAFDKAALYGQPSGHLAVVASGASDLASLDNESITERAATQLAAALPGVRSRRLRNALVVREHRATFAVPPGSPARPSAVTPLAGFLLAGDWVDTGLPGTIESAVASGHRAADAAISHCRQADPASMAGG